MRPRVLPVGIACLALVLCVSPFVAEGASQSAAPVLASGRLVDQDAGLSFAVPAGWTLRDSSISGNVTIIHEASGASFFVARKAEASEGLESEFNSLKLALPFVGGRWSKLSDGWRKVGGRRAGEVAAIRAYPNAEPVKQWDLVVVYRGHAYVMEGEVPQSHVDTRWSDLVSIVESVEWQK